MSTRASCHDFRLVNSGLKTVKFQARIMITSLAPEAMLLSLLVIDSLSSPSSDAIGFEEPLELSEPPELLPDARPEEDTLK